MFKSIKLAWLNCISTSKYQPVVNVHFKYIYLAQFINCSYRIEDIPSNLPRFYKQMLEIWYQIKKECKSNLNKQSLWFNEHILCNKKTLFYKDFYAKNMIYITDIISENRFMSFEEAKHKFNLNNGDFLQYLTVVKSIPDGWISIIKNVFVSARDDFVYDINSTHLKLNISTAKSKSSYNILLHTASTQPTSVEKWNNMYNELDWKLIFCLPFKIITSTKIQTFQFKILMRIFPCNKQLFIWKIVHSPRCNACYEIDTIEHHLYECNPVKEFWHAFQTWLHIGFEYYINFFVIDIVFGVFIDDMLMHVLINYCIFIAKYYIFIQKFKSEHISFSAYLRDLKHRIEIEMIIEKSTLKDSEGNIKLHPLNLIHDQI